MDFEIVTESDIWGGVLCLNNPNLAEKPLPRWKTPPWLKNPTQPNLKILNFKLFQRALQPWLHNYSHYYFPPVIIWRMFLISAEDSFNQSHSHWWLNAIYKHISDPRSKRLNRSNRFREPDRGTESTVNALSECTICISVKSEPCKLITKLITQCIHFNCFLMS